MSPEILFLIILLAFICEIINSSLGMLYGTILSPLLILIGFDPLTVIPSILLSQAIAGLIAAIRHHKLKNVEFKIKQEVIKRLSELGYIETIKKGTSRDLKVSLCITSLGIIAMILAVFIAVNISKILLKTYIGVLVLIMGTILMLRSKFEFSWRKIFGLGVLSAFNKGMTGGGFGPVVTSGQLIAGRKTKEAIGTTMLSEVPICLTGFFVYLIENGLQIWNLAILLTIGAIIGAIIGPTITAKFESERKLKSIMGIVTTILGIGTLIKTWLL